MFRWKKRDEGFEWHQYVRTTIKLRREARRDKAQKLGAQVAEGAKAAGQAADVLAKSSSRKFWSLLKTTTSLAGQSARSGVALIGLGLGSLAGHGGAIFAPVVDVLGRPSVGGPLTFAGLIAIIAGGARAAFATKGLDGEAIAALSIGGICLALGVGPALRLGHAALPTRLAAPITGLPTRPWLAAIAMGITGLIAAIGFTVMPGGVALPRLASLTALPFASGETLAGRASPIATDLLKIGDRRVRLAGIEVPDLNQRCVRAGSRGGARTWACGADAREALQRLIQGQTVTCEVTSDVAGIARGRCSARGTDVGEALVKAGHAFAESGLLTSYRQAEDAAKTTKAGIWGAAEPERPAQWRDRLWTEAKRAAPDGCPIKGRVSSDGRYYLLPWASNYGRVRIRKGRGERWFCSQDEAEAAGWRNAQSVDG